MKRRDRIIPPCPDIADIVVASIDQIYPTAKMIQKLV
jgi:hypothetical protein